MVEVTEVLVALGVCAVVTASIYFLQLIKKREAEEEKLRKAKLDAQKNESEINAQPTIVDDFRENSTTQFVTNIETLKPNLIAEEGEKTTINENNEGFADDSQTNKNELLDDTNQNLLIEELKSLDNESNNLSLKENEVAIPEVLESREVKTIKQNEVISEKLIGTVVDEVVQIENLKPIEVEDNLIFEEKQSTENTYNEDVKAEAEEEFKKEIAEKILDLDINNSLNDINDEISTQLRKEDVRPVEKEVENVGENSKPEHFEVEATSEVKPEPTSFEKEHESCNKSEITQSDEKPEIQVDRLTKNTEELAEQIVDDGLNYKDCGYGKIDISLFYDKTRSKLSLTVHSAENLINVDKKSLSDPYAKIMLLPDENKKSKQKTKVIKDNLNPHWEETFEWTMTVAEAKSKTLQIELKDEKSIFTKQDTVFLGKMAFPLMKADIYTKVLRKSLWLQPESNIAGLIHSFS